MPKTKFFVDFDDTLFDRSKFSDDLFSLLRSFNFTDSELDHSYRAVYDFGYDGIWAQLLYLNDNVRSIDLKKAKKMANGFLSNTYKYLYPETLPFLKSIDRNKYQVELITVGGLRFQKEKVKNSAILSLFDRCNFTTLEKAKTLKRLVKKDERFILIDDKEREITNVKSTFPNALIYKACGGKLLQYVDPIN